MAFTRVSDSKFRLHQAPSSFYKIESWTKFIVRELHMIDIFSGQSHSLVAPKGMKQIEPSLRCRMTYRHDKGTAVNRPQVLS